MSAGGGSQLTVLYDGACPLCRREIAWYRRLPARETIRWLDVADPTVDLPAGIAREAALARFHVVEGEDGVVSGAAAFLRLWRAYPGLAWAARLLSPRPLRLLLEAGYVLFLRARPWLTGRARCRRGACTT